MEKLNLMFFDFEVYRTMWLVVFIDYETRERFVIIDDRNALMDFYQKYKDYIFCGYNSRYYDQWILKGILCGLDAYDVNNQLIFEDKNGYQIVPDCPYHLNNFDCMFDKLKGLKQIEGFMGSMIKETDVPFDLPRKLTPEEVDQVVEYCTHDVEQTILVYENTKVEFDSQYSLIEAFGLDMEMFNKTKAQLAATILGAERKPERGDEFNISIPDTLVIGEKYQYIVDWYMNPANRNKKRYLDTMVAGIPHTFAWGGLHGSVDNLNHEGLILCCDVALT